MLVSSVILKLAVIVAEQLEQLQEAACGSEAVHQDLADPFAFDSQPPGFLAAFAVAFALVHTYSIAQVMMAAIQVSEVDQLVAMFLACFVGCNYQVQVAASYFEHQVPGES